VDIKRSYYEDIELFKSKTVLAWSVVLLAVLILLPWFIAKTHFLGISVYLLNLIIIHCIVAIGLNILVATPARFPWAMRDFSPSGPLPRSCSWARWDFPCSSPCPWGAHFRRGRVHPGLPSLRLEGPYLAIATMGFGMAVTTIIKHMEFFGGRMGLQAPKLYFFETP